MLDMEGLPMFKELVMESKYKNFGHGKVGKGLTFQPR